MAVQATIQSVRVVNGVWYVRANVGGNTQEMEFGSLEAMKDFIRPLDGDPQNAMAWAIAWWLARSADGSNVNLIAGKTVTVDASAASPIRVQ